MSKPDLYEEYYELRERLDPMLPYTDECGKAELHLMALRKRIEQLRHGKAEPYNNMTAAQFAGKAEASAPVFSTMCTCGGGHRADNPACPMNHPMPPAPPHNPALSPTDVPNVYRINDAPPPVAERWVCRGCGGLVNPDALLKSGGVYHSVSENAFHSAGYCGPVEKERQP